jgi:NADPH:quinone reductase-like Zn-dependent oxidoreductase
MKAVGVIGPDFVPRLFDIDEPTALSDGVVVEVLGSSVNEFDRAAARGQFIGAVKPQDPVLLGRDFVGKVVTVGDDVRYIDVGMYVAGAVAPKAAWQPGTFTDKVAVPAQSLAPVPDGVDLAYVAGVGLSGVTALDAVGTLGIIGLETVMIHGPVSGVGGFALQLAKARGALVTALTNPEQEELEWTLGADGVIPEDADPAQSVQKVRDLFGGGVDSVIHVAGHFSVTANVLRAGGKYTTTVAGATTPVMGCGSVFVPTVVAPNGHKLADLLFKVAALRLRSHVSATVSFDQVGAALSPHNNGAGRVVVLR